MTLAATKHSQVAPVGAPTNRMKVLAVGSQKGGAAKSTTSLYLATRFAEYMGGTEDKPVVGLLDRDGTSKNLSQMVDYRPELLRPGVTLLDGETLPREAEGLKLVVIDTPPGLAAIDSLKSADLLVVPVVPSDQGVLNLQRYLQILETQRILLSPQMRVLALLPANVENTALHRARLDDIRAVAATQRTPLPVLPPVPHRARIDRWDLSAPEYDEPAKELFGYARV